MSQEIARNRMRVFFLPFRYPQPAGHQEESSSASTPAATNHPFEKRPLISNRFVRLNKIRKEPRA
jgi:hypothetical protein